MTNKNIDTLHGWIKGIIIFLHVVLILFIALITGTGVGWISMLILFSFPKWYDTKRFTIEAAERGITMFEHLSSDIPESEFYHLQEMRECCVHDDKCFVAYNRYLQLLLDGKKITKKQFKRLLLESNIAYKSKYVIQIKSKPSDDSDINSLDGNSSNDTISKN